MLRFYFPFRISAYTGLRAAAVAAVRARNSAAELGTIPAGAFPREMSVSADGRTLFVTNFGSNSLQVMDVEHLPIAPKRHGSEPAH